MLGDGADLREVLQLKRHARTDAIADQAAFGGFPVVHGFNGIRTELGGLGIDCVVAHDLANLLGLFRGKVVGGFGIFSLGGDVELHHSGIGSRFELTVGPGENRVGSGVDVWRLCEKNLRCEKNWQQENDSFHGYLRSRSGRVYTALSEMRTEEGRDLAVGNLPRRRGRWRPRYIQIVSLQRL